MIADYCDALIADYIDAMAVYLINQVQQEVIYMYITAIYIYYDLELLLFGQ